MGPSDLESSFLGNRLSTLLTIASAFWHARSAAPLFVFFTTTLVTVANNNTLHNIAGADTLSAPTFDGCQPSTHVSM